MSEPVNDLIFDYPDCMVCDDGGDMTFDEGYVCLTCGTTWNRDGTHGERYEDDTP